MAPARSFQSAQDFVRALRAPSDPPVAGGPLKIEIAQNAWTDSSFYVPSKAKIISEWILTKLLKEKAKDIAENPVFDTRYWNLLHSLNTPTEGSTKGWDIKQRNVWLTPLLNRVPLAPVVIAFLNAYNTLDEGQRSELSTSVNACLSTLWPLSAQKMGTEMLQDCYGAVLSVLSSSSSPLNTCMAKLGSMISASYRLALTNSSNKKKLYQTFLNSHLRNWMQSLSFGYLPEQQPFSDVVLESGIETLFNLDVLRQTNDQKTEPPFLEHLRKLLASGRDHVYRALPRLYSSYVNSIKKHRGALFSQGSQSQPGAALEEFHEAALRLFTSMLALVDHNDQDALSWMTRLSLLQTVDQENLFDRHQMEAQMTLNQLVDLIIIALNDAWKDAYLECTTIAIQCLSTIARIDYDLMLPFMPRILPLFLQISLPSEQHFAFLEILLSYHTKTRTLGVLVQNLFAALSSPTQYPQGPMQRYQLSFSSPVMHNFFMSRLSKALLRFLTESQCVHLVEFVSNTLKTSWDTFYSNIRQNNSDSDEKPRKRRKTDTDVGGQDVETVAVVYSLMCRLASAVLSSLPISSLSSESLASVRQALENFRADAIHTAISKCLRVLKKQDAKNLWPTEIVTVAALRLYYALSISRNLSLSVACDKKLIGKFTELLASEEVLPELTLELYRTLLYNMAVGNPTEHELIFDRLLSYLESNFSPADVRWSGDNHHLTKGESGRAEASVAILYMIIERWLPQLDRLASQTQLEGSLKLLLSVKVNPVRVTTQQIQPEQLLMQLLHSAQFWEFHNIRNVFLAILDKAIASINSSELQSGKPSTVQNASIYRYLLFFPLEYFSSQILNDMVKHAVAVDVCLSGLESPVDSEVTEALIIIRGFLKRAYAYIGSVDQEQGEESSEFLIHLLKSTPSEAELATEFTRATLDLVELYLLKLLKVAKKNRTNAIIEVLRTFSAGLFSVSTDFFSLGFSRLVELVEREFPAATLPNDVVSTLTKLQEDITSAIIPRVNKLATEKIPKEMVGASAKLISGWRSLLSLRKWLNPSNESSDGMPLIGEMIVVQLMPALKVQDDPRTPDLDEFCVNTFAILLQELDSLPSTQHSAHLDIVMASYIYFSQVFSLTSRQILDSHLTKSCRKLIIEDYVYLTTFVADSLSCHNELSSQHLLHLVHLASLVLHEHPTHSLVHVQKFTTRCLNIFNNDPIFVQGPVELREEVLKLLSKHCSDQQTALRLQDAAAIWLLLSKYLAPSPVHDQVTTTTIFHEIVSILSSLVRLRRDLVTHALPHLGMLLRQLLFCMRACRPNLGAKQTNMIMNTQPRWINSTQALGPEEAKMLGRLLEGLLTKTTVRFLASASSGPENQKAESLAKPFSKHAAYVLEAYIESMNDPLCVLSLDVRKELQAGVFALCSMISEHSRDALMASALDAGGKVISKTLWREYDKQKYVGKG
ncbi:hypothetical protein CPC08DRAFT_690317 [Agrocybe pediades]|nr:hypothetical protein CPC08DRAFT_690317 [Agrocybe pediades]